MANKNCSSFYAYTHARPDGSVFYVGKGRGRRAWDYAQSRRTLHHRNIIKKYGIEAIIVTVYPTETEDEAFALECKMIASMPGLINLTTGGEGASGIKATGARIEALAKGRRSWDERGLSADSRARILAGALKGLPAVNIWRKSPEGKECLRTLSIRSAAATAAREPRSFICVSCMRPFDTRSLKPNIRYCGKACQQRGRSLELKAAKVDAPPNVYSNNSSGRTGVYWNKAASVWVALIGVEKKIIYLGRYANMRAAIAARETAELQYGRGVPRRRSSSIRPEAKIHLPLGGAGQLKELEHSAGAFDTSSAVAIAHSVRARVTEFDCGERPQTFIGSD